MRILLATAMLLCVLAVVATPAEARAVACTDVVNTNCQGFVCYDENLDCRLTSDECIYQYCPGGCCTCPPPDWW